MSAFDDQGRYAEEDAMERFLDDQLRQLSEGAAFYYLARFGDAIEERVRRCEQEAIELKEAGFYGASLVRTAAAIEITIRFFLARPLLQGAFLSDDWAATLAERILKQRTADDRDLLPAILRNWGIDVGLIKLPDGSKMWDQILGKVWTVRNKYVHAGESVSQSDAMLAIACLQHMLDFVVTPVSLRLGFTRKETGSWSIVLSRGDRNLNPPAAHETSSPFRM